MDMKGAMDWIGLMLVGAALTLLDIGLGSPEISLEESTVPPPQHRVYWIAAAVVSFSVFLISQVRVSNSILYVHIFSKRNLSSACGVNMLVGFCVMFDFAS